MNRHEARQKALELLYSREFHGEQDVQYAEMEIFDKDYILSDDLTEEEKTPDDSYCGYLVDTVTAHKDELDQVISGYAKNWNIARMNVTDRNILRLALCELKFPKEGLASSIVLNEAIILAKEFSGEKAAKFVNGILGAYVKAQG